MSVVTLSVQDPDDPNGTALGTLTDADVIAFKMRNARDEVGSGEITIPRDHAKAALLVPGRYVKCTFPAIHANPVWGFWLRPPKVVVKHETERELMVIGGPGPRGVLRNGRLLNTIHAPGQPDEVTEPNIIDEANKQWFWSHLLASQIGYGSILVRGLEEGQNQPGTPFEHLTWDFNRDVDSDSVLWPTLTEDFSIPLGSDILELSQRLQELGEFTIIVHPDLSVQAFQTYGTDRSSATFAAGKVRIVATDAVSNVLTGIESNHHLDPATPGLAPTHVIVEGTTGFRQVVSPSYVAGEPGRWDHLSHPETDADAVLDAYGAEYLARWEAGQDALDIAITPGDDEANGLYLPFKHFLPGDTITVHTGTGIGDYNNSALELTGFRIELAEATEDTTADLQARSLKVALEINQRGVSEGWPGGGPRFSNPTVIQTSLSWTTLELSYWDASGNLVTVNAEPVSWKQVGFDDSAWDAVQTGQDHLSTVFEIEHPNSDLALRRHEVIYRHEFWIDEAALTGPDAVFRYAADDGGELYVNGVQIATLGTRYTDGGHHTDDHETTIARSVFQAGLNCIAAHIWNHTDGTNGANPPGGMSLGVYIGIPAANQNLGSGSAALPVGSVTHAAIVPITDLGNHFTGGTVEAALQEVAAGGGTNALEKSGGEKHTVSTVAASGAAETLDLADGNLHDVTLTDDCTFTFTGATNGVACYLTLILRQDGTGSRTVTWPASVSWPDGTAPTLATGANEVDAFTFLTVDGGVTWFGTYMPDTAVVAALDDLTDVTITSPASGDKLRYDGSVWVNANLHDEPMIASDGSVMTDGDLNPMMHEVAW